MSGEIGKDFNPANSSFELKMGIEPGSEGTASVMNTYFNMFKTFIGIGILATPAAFKQVGIFGGMLGIIVCGLLNLYT